MNLTRGQQIRAIALQIESVLDYGIVVDDGRRDVDRAVERLRGAVRERDRAEEHLERLFDLIEAEEIA